MRFERSYESFNSNADNVWRITLDVYNGSEYVVTDCETHAPMAPLLKSRFPEVIDYVRMYSADGLNEIKVNDAKFLESGLYFADPSVVNILDVKIIEGDPTKILNEPYQVVMSRSDAKKYFGNSEAVGQTISLEGVLFNVTGVFEDRPANTHLKFNMLLSHETLPKTRSWYTIDNWDGNNEFAYLLMKPGTDIAEFNQKLLEVCAELKDKLSDDKYVAQPVKDIHLYSDKTFEPEANGNAKTVSFLSVIALFIIVIAWVNYMNLATARAIERAREVGIRKVMGSLRVQLILQFLTESFIVNLVAAFIAVAMVQMAMPLFRLLTGMPEVATDNLYWMIVAGLAIVGSLLSGIYPAFVLSSFRPITVLKGKFQSSSHGQALRKILVIFQFAATIVLIIGVSVVYLQVQHLRTVDLGANLEHTVALRMPIGTMQDSLFKIKSNALKIEALRDASITSSATSSCLPGIPISEMSTSRWSIVGREKESGQYTYYWYYIDQNYLKTLGIQLAAGRNFETDKEVGNILINETAAKLLGFANSEDAVGRQMTFYDQRVKKNSTIIGVVKDFHQRSPKEEFLPQVFAYMDDGGYFLARFSNNNPVASIDRLKESWNKVFAGEPFSYFFVDQNFDEQYHADIQFGQVMGTFSILAVMIACLGLFGLSSYTILQRRKEIGIRKVLGANVSQVVRLLSGSYMKVVLISSLLALPIAWVAVDNWLSSYTTRITLNAWMFIIPAVMILFLALITVSFQTIRSALVNPAISLKDE